MPSKNDRSSGIIIFNKPDIWQNEPEAARPLLWNKMCGFRDGYALENIDQMQNDPLLYNKIC